MLRSNALASHLHHTTSHPKLRLPLPSVMCATMWRHSWRPCGAGTERAEAAGLNTSGPRYATALRVVLLPGTCHSALVHVAAQLLSNKLRVGCVDGGCVAIVHSRIIGDVTQHAQDGTSVAHGETVVLLPPASHLT